ncbi:MAG: DUF3291 domain-containing protein [Sphingomonas sp.]|nr:DUF3291 domain-containing protein [Sphingomonas sp.]
MSRDWHLAQINIGRLVAPYPDPRVVPFFDALDTINAVAEASPGFVWRLQDDSGNAMDIRYAPDPLLAVNMSVWADAESLFDFVYRTAHTPVMARRRDYFARLDGAYQALWWIQAGTQPTVADGLAKLWLLDRFGPCPQAFTFKARFPAPDEAGPPVDHQPDPWCVGSA